ncbi:hypothetical protein HPP92_004767 [Vanilla planifolia]|uniref:Embryo sac development arrest 6 n=1 Tax=Vanilla planifolia TaxID=51239 RepID=A0A835RXE2_VANPL|nr:hypothetical protein HPP92_005121 [Vanilla planifolia]KAG0493773.1 hypothetical protein HPP92_004767 [Vanilla planifolia]
MSTHIHPISRKRKEREAAAKAELLISPPPISPPPPPISPPPPPTGNRLLAGYMAHEFLTKGTLFGKRWAQERSEPSSNLAGADRSGSVNDAPAHSTQAVKAYAEVANLLMTDGVHIPGIVNPTQLAKWLQM